jgi:hypothetical protein
MYDHALTYCIHSSRSNFDHMYALLHEELWELLLYMFHIAIHANLATYIGKGQHGHSTFI